MSVLHTCFAAAAVWCSRVIPSDFSLFKIRLVVIQPFGNLHLQSETKLDKSKLMDDVIVVVAIAIHCEI